MACEPGDQLGDPPPLGPGGRPEATAQQPVWWGDLLQDRGDIAGVDVFPLQAPIKPHHHHGPIAGSRQPSRRFGVGTIAVVDGQIRPRLPQALQWRDRRSRRRTGVRGAAVAEVQPIRQLPDHRQGAQIQQRQYRLAVEKRLVAQQHDSLARRLAGQGQMLRAAAHRWRDLAGGDAQLQP